MTNSNRLHPTIEARLKQEKVMSKIRINERKEKDESKTRRKIAIEKLRIEEEKRTFQDRTKKRTS